MRKVTSGLGVLVLAGLVTVVALGCATGSGTAKAIGANDLSMLAGKWSGSVTPPSGKSTPGTLEISPTGDYVARAGAFAAQGKAAVKDGKLVLMSTSTSGGIATGQRTSTAALSQRPDGSLVLRGRGLADAGPFDFEVSRPK